ncbi:hypothetical protein C8R46DRAFT_254842 [Mycena filopes]|nr:hypothetical protein C8R46DRAFT_254842 [Mycena filopes]
MPTADLRRRLVELDAKIIEEAVLDALKSDRSAVRQELEDTSTFPILTLPIEITTEIFVWCLPTIEELREDHVSRSEGKPVEPHAPLTLASCCRLWRAITLGTSSLWTTFPLFLKHRSIASSRPGREELAAYIQRWLGRAPTGPLTFVFHTPPPQPYPYNKDANIKTALGCVGNTLALYALRLEHLDLVANDLDLPTLLNLNSVHFPLLRRIVMGVDLNDPEPYPHDEEETFDAPKFCELLLRDSGVLSSYPLPLRRLTRFEGGIDDLQLFQLAPNLVEAKCCFRLTDSSPLAFETDITHSRLQSLTLSSSCSAEDITGILGRLTLPALLSLDLPDDWPTDAAALHSLLKRSNPPLKSLAVHVGVDDVENPFDQYDASFSVVDATLENLDIHSPSLAFMSSIWHTHSLLPQLKALALLSCPPVDYKIVLTFLYQRSSSIALATLESFHLHHSEKSVFHDKRFTVPKAGGTPRTIKGHMRKLESKGTRIQIRSSTRDLFKSKI